MQSEALPDFSLVLSRIADRRSFAGVLRYDGDAVDRLRERNEQQSLVLLSGHRSYLDFVLRVPLAERGLDREFRFAGANIDIWPVGTVLRSAGMVFVRRGYRNPVYWFVQRQYMAWLTEHRANFWWAIEGGRTRTGKLLRPKAGLLTYLAEAYASGHGRDVALVPATVVREYLHEVEEFAADGRGAAKVPESLMLGVRLTRQARRVPEEAQIHLGFGEPVALSDYVEPGLEAEELPGAIERAAMEVCRRIDAATPITAVALVLVPILERDGVQLSLDELVVRLAPIVDRIVTEDLPTFETSLGGRRDLERALQLLSTQGIVATEGSGDVTRYSVAAGRHLEAAYYRNAIVHFFVVASMAEIAVARTGAVGEGERVAGFWRTVGELRALLDLEFFFPEGEAFDSAVQAVLLRRAPDWETTLEQTDGVGKVGERLQPCVAPSTLAPFLEAHGLVANELARPRRPRGRRRRVLRTGLPRSGRARARGGSTPSARRGVVEHVRHATADSKAFRARRRRAGGPAPGARRCPRRQSLGAGDGRGLGYFVDSPLRVRIDLRCAS